MTKGGTKVIQQEVKRRGKQVLNQRLRKEMLMKKAKGKKMKIPLMGVVIDLRGKRKHQKSWAFMNMKRDKQCK